MDRLIMIVLTASQNTLYTYQGNSWTGAYYNMEFDIRKC